MCQNLSKKTNDLKSKAHNWLILLLYYFTTCTLEFFGYLTVMQFYTNLADCSSFISKTPYIRFDYVLLFYLNSTMHHNYYL